MKDIKELVNNSKERNGFVTAWLILMIIANSIITFIYLIAVDFNLEDPSSKISKPIIVIIGVIGLANVIFSILILKGRKIGFWGFAFASLINFIINLNLGTSLGKSLIGLLGVFILYKVLQIKKNSRSAWENLE